MSNHRISSRTIQCAVRFPLDLHAALVANGQPLSVQVIAALRDAVAEEARPRRAKPPAYDHSAECARQFLSSDELNAAVEAMAMDLKWTPIPRFASKSAGYYQTEQLMVSRNTMATWHEMYGEPTEMCGRVTIWYVIWTRDTRLNRYHYVLPVRGGTLVRTEKMPY